MGTWNAEWFTVPGAAVFDTGRPITSVSRSEENVDLFVVGNDNRVWSQFWSAQAGWHGDWFPVPGQAVFDGQPVAAVARDAEHLDLFVVGYDNRVWSQFWSAQTGWHGDWMPVPGQAVFDGQPVAAVARDKDHLDLFLVGHDNRVWSQYWSAERGWAADWAPVPGAAVFDGQPVAAVARDGEHLDLFVVGHDNRVWSQFWSAQAGWHADWMPVPGAAVFDQQPVAALSRDRDRLDLFLLGKDNHVWTQFWSADGGWNTDWFAVPGAAVFEQGRHITTASRVPGHIDLYVMGNDSHVWTTNWSAEQGWAADWFPVPGQAVFDRHQPVTAVSRRGNHLDLFVLGLDNHVWSTYWHHRTLQFRLRYFVEKESTDAVLQGGDDEVYVSALGVDSASVVARPDGTYGAEVVKGGEIGDVSEDDVRDPWRDRPHVLMEFDIDRPGPWPRSYTTTLLVIEHDDGDLRSGFDTLYGAFGGQIRDAVVKAATTAGAVITGAAVAGAIGALAGAAFDAVNEKIRSGLADESFTPIPITVGVDGPERFAGHPAMERPLTQKVEQFGGSYEILYDWHVA
ncbi:hypothetical protein ACFYU9_18030 [Streptomyces sp. NPDC004327]|uniref:hypothetical protein n=1 Tax=Streptomyces sp. NPDC004327 TaxID=3364699 RepID=UPI0036CC4465